MAPFAMCAACRREYEDPADRRFHAQPNACPVCGPSLRLIDSARATPVDRRTTEAATFSGDAVAALAEHLADGSIAAVKGLGGYHLVCDAADEHAVAALRARKHREHKPFALMVADLDAARALVDLDACAQALLTFSARPIVLAPRRDGAPRGRRRGARRPGARRDAAVHAAAPPAAGGLPR